MKRWAAIVAAVLLGYLIGRIVPPPAPDHWDEISVGMPFEDVYREVPELRGSMREAKGFDIAWARTGSRHWVLQVHYDSEGKVNEIEREFDWGW